MDKSTSKFIEEFFSKARRKNISKKNDRNSIDVVSINDVVEVLGLVVMEVILNTYIIRREINKGKRRFGNLISVKPTAFSNLKNDSIDLDMSFKNRFKKIYLKCSQSAKSLA